MFFAPQRSHSRKARFHTPALLKRLVATLTILAMTGATYQEAGAITLLWDTVSGDGGTTTGGSGTWTTGLGNWNTGANDAIWSSATPDSAMFNGTGGTVTLGGAVTVGGMTFNVSGYTVAGGGNVLTLSNSTITTNFGSATISAVLSGTTGLIKNGAGTLNLTANNTYTGTTTINAGSLFLGSGTNSGSVSGDIINNGALVFANFSGVNLAQTISGTGRVTSNLGTNTLSGTNTYTGATMITAGSNILVSSIGNGGAASNLGAASSEAGNIVLNANGALNFIGTGSVNNTDRLFSVGATGGVLAAGGTGSINFTNTGSMGFNNISGARILTLTGANTGSNSVAAAIGDNGGATSITKSGASTWLLTGTNSSYSGATTISSGVLGAASLANGGVNSSLGAATNAATNLVLNGGTLQYTGTGSSTDRLFSVGTTVGSKLDSSGSGPVNFTNTGSMGFNGQNGARSLTLTGTNSNANTLAAVIGDSGGATSLTKSGTGTWVLNGTNTYSGNTIISEGSLQIGSGGTSGTLGSGSITDNGNLTVNRSNSITMSNTISGSGSFTQAGTGATTLGGANSYVGATRITGGVLIVTTLANGGSASNIGSSGNAATNLILDGGTLRYSPGAGAAVSTDRLFSVGTAGGTIDASGGFNINFTNTGSMGFNGQSGARTLTLTGNNANDNTLAAVIGDNAGATSVTKTGGGIWLLSGASTYTGATTMSGTGVLKVSSLANGGVASSIGASSSAAGNLVLNGGTFMYMGGLVSTDRLFSLGTAGATINVFGSGGITFTNTGSMGFNGQSGARTLTLANASGGTSTLAAVIGDNGGPTSLTRINAGIWALSGASTYTGVTAINGNIATILSVANLANGGVASNIGAATSDAANLVLNGGTLRYTGAGSSTDRLFSLGTNGISLDASGTGDLKFTNTGSMEFNGQSGARTLSLIGTSLGFNTLASVIGDNGGATSVSKLGTGKWVLTGNNTYSGTTTISGGVLQIGHSTASGTVGSGNIVNNGTLVLFRSDSFTLSNVISGTGTVSNAQGTGRLSGMNTYTGFTSISTGTLVVDTLANGGSPSNIGASSSAAGNLQLNGGTFRYVGPAVSTDRLFSVGTSSTLDASGTGALNFTNTGALVLPFTLARTFTLTGTNTDANTLAPSLGDNTAVTSLVKSGTGTWVLTGANTYTGITTISGGVLQVGNGGTTGALGAGFVFNNANLTINRSNAVTIANTISGTGSLTQAGTGTTTLTGISTYSGSTTIDAGTLQIGNGGITGSLGGGAIVNNGTLTFNRSDAVTLGNTVSGGGTFVQAGTGTITLTGLFNPTGPVMINTGGLQVGNGGLLGGLGSGNVTNNGSLIINRSNAYTLFNAISGTGSLTQAGSGTTTINTANSYTGATIITGGVLSVTALANGGSNSSIGASSSTAANLVLNGGTLKFTGVPTSTNRLFSVGTAGGTLDASGLGASALNLTSTGSMGFNSQSGARTLTLTGTSTGNNTLAAIIGDNGGATSLTKAGAGTWILTGTNTYTGTTTITAGTLQLGTFVATGTLGSGPVVNNGNLIVQKSSSIISNAISGSGNLTISSATILTGTNSYTGTTTINSGLTIGTGVINSGTLGTGPVVLNSSGSLTFSRNATQAVGNVISGTGVLFVQLGNVELTAANSYSGFTSVLGGTLTLSGSNSSAGMTFVNGGITKLNSPVNGGLAGGLVNFAAGTLQAINAARAISNDVKFNGVHSTISGSQDLTINGSVTVANNVVLDSSVASAHGLVFNGGMYLSDAADVARSFTLSGSGNTTFAGVIADFNGTGVAGSMVFSNTGVATLSGNNTYTGSTVVNSGTLEVSLIADGGTSSSIGASANGAANLVLSGGILRHIGGTASTDRLFSVGTNGGTLEASGTGDLKFTNTGAMGFNGQAGTRTLTLAGTNVGASSLAAAIGDNGAATSLSKSGTGTWVLTGDSSYTGVTTISGGVLAVSSLANAGANSALGSAASAASNLVLYGGMLQYIGAGSSSDRLFSVGTATGSTLDASGTGPVSFTGTGTIGFNGQSGPRLLTLTGTNTEANTIAAAIGDNGGATSLAKSGPGVWSLSGSSTYSGSTTVASGILEVTASGALGSSIGGTVVGNGAALRLNNVDYAAPEALELNGTGGGAGALVNVGNSSYAGTITAESDATINAGGGALTLMGGLIKDGTVLTITGGGTVTINDIGISGASADSDLVVDGTQVIVNADSDYNGPTTVKNAGELVVNAAVVTTQADISADSVLSGAGSLTTAPDQSLWLNGTLSVGAPVLPPAASSLSLTTSGAGAIVLGSATVVRLDLFSGAGLGDNSGNNASADFVNLHGKMDVTGGGTLVIGNPAQMTGYRGGDQWKLFDFNTGDSNPGEIVGSFALNDSAVGLTSGFTGHFDEDTGLYTVIDTNGGSALAAAATQMMVSGASTVTSDLSAHIFSLQAAGEPGTEGEAVDAGVIMGEGDGNPDQPGPVGRRVPAAYQWKAFTTVNYGNIKLSPMGTQAGVQVDSWAPGIGFERQISRGLVLGFAASFLESDQGYTDGAGSLHLEGPALSAYVSFTKGGFWSSLLYSFGDYELDSTRNAGVGFPLAFGTTQTQTHAVQYNGGWNFRFMEGSLVTGPFLGLDYLHGEVDAYSETGGGLAALRYSSQTYESLVARVGWSVSKRFETSFATITPQLRLSYERQNIEDNNGTTVSVINAPFSTTGGNQAPGQDYMVLGLGVSLMFDERFSMMLTYQGQFFRHDLQAHFGGLRFTYRF